MKSCVRKCSRPLNAFSVASILTAARTQTESSVCAGDLSAGGSASGSVGSTPSRAGSVESFSWFFAGAPNAPISFYRDDADGIDRTVRLRQHPADLFKTQPLTEFQMLRADSAGQIVSACETARFADVPDAIAPMHQLKHARSRSPIGVKQLALLQSNFTFRAPQPSHT